MTVKEEFIEKARILLTKAELNDSVDEEIQEVVELLNVLRQSVRLFKVAMTEAGFSDSHAEFLAEFIVENQQLIPYWKDQMREILRGPTNQSQPSTGSKKKLTLPKISMYNGTPGE